MKKPLLLLFAAALLATGLACSSSSSSSSNSGTSSGIPGLTGPDYTAFVKQQVVTKPDTTNPVDVSQTTFTNFNYDNPDAYDDVLGIPSATLRGDHWSTVR